MAKAKGKAVVKEVKVVEKKAWDETKPYVLNFTTALVSGTAGEVFSLVQGGKWGVAGLTSTTFSDGIILTGVQQVAKDVTKAVLKKSSAFAQLSTSCPFLFGAATGIPMWTLTRIVGTPLQNSHKKGTKPYAGFVPSVVNDAAYYTIKNGLDEYAAVTLLPKVIFPSVSGTFSKKLIEAGVSGVIGGGCYLLGWPYKRAVAQQALADAKALTVKMTPKVALKKFTFGLAKPVINGVLP